MISQASAPSLSPSRSGSSGSGVDDQAAARAAATWAPNISNCFHGFSMDFPWIFHGISIVVLVSMDFQ